jgi:murein L,D-transpeptidase YcbB/YkuD
MKIKRVELNPSIPIVMDYQTCFINLKGKIMFREDIYKLDVLLNKQLANISL